MGNGHKTASPNEPMEILKNDYTFTARPIKTVSESLGHATVAFTLDVYGHVTDTMRKASADRMQAFIESIGS